MSSPPPSAPVILKKALNNMVSKFCPTILAFLPSSKMRFNNFILHDKVQGITTFSQTKSLHEKTQVSHPHCKPVITCVPKYHQEEGRVLVATAHYNSN